MAVSCLPSNTVFLPPDTDPLHGRRLPAVVPRPGQQGVTFLWHNNSEKHFIIPAERFRSVANTPFNHKTSQYPRCVAIGIPICCASARWAGLSAALDSALLPADCSSRSAPALSLPLLEPSTVSPRVSPFADVLSPCGAPCGRPRRVSLALQTPRPSHGSPSTLQYPLPQGGRVSFD